VLLDTLTVQTWVFLRVILDVFSCNFVRYRLSADAKKFSMRSVVLKLCNFVSLRKEIHNILRILLIPRVQAKHINSNAVSSRI
jgi:hypothetical protein